MGSRCDCRVWRAGDRGSQEAGSWFFRASDVGVAESSSDCRDEQRDSRSIICRISVGITVRPGAGGVADLLLQSHHTSPFPLQQPFVFLPFLVVEAISDVELLPQRSGAIGEVRCREVCYDGFVASAGVSFVPYLQTARSTSAGLGVAV
jgi:hypothetical protein